jgi:hypothetical protein
MSPRSLRYFEMIPFVETYGFEFVKEHHIALWANDTELLKKVMQCHSCPPNPSIHMHPVASFYFAPDHVKWLEDEMEGWCLVEFAKDSAFVYWFTDETDAIVFQRVFDERV